MQATSSASPLNSEAMTTPPSLRILMLHGYTQSGTLFRAKTRALEKHLQKAFSSPGQSNGMISRKVEFVYPTAPIRIPPASIPGFSSSDSDADETSIEAYGWWRRKGDGETASIVYEGMEAGLSLVAEYLRGSGPFDGVVGFSQGGALAAIVASLLEPGRVEAVKEQAVYGGISYPESFLASDGQGLVHQPLKFAVIYSGFLARNATLYAGLYNPKIKTPMLHFLGTMDTIVEESRSLSLVEACENGKNQKLHRVVYHPGGHFVPSSHAQPLTALIAFIQETLSFHEEPESTSNKNEKVEDMEMPF